MSYSTNDTLPFYLCIPFLLYFTYQIIDFFITQQLILTDNFNKYPSNIWYKYYKPKLHILSKPPIYNKDEWYSYPITLEDFDKQSQWIAPRERLVPRERLDKLVPRVIDMHKDESPTPPIIETKSLCDFFTINKEEPTENIIHYPSYEKERLNYLEKQPYQSESKWITLWDNWFNFDSLLKRTTKLKF
jgi:hypothetical protein